jgi:hypothetical protein
MASALVSEAPDLDEESLAGLLSGAVELDELEVRCGASLDRAALDTWVSLSMGDLGFGVEMVCVSVGVAGAAMVVVMVFSVVAEVVAVLVVVVVVAAVVGGEEGEGGGGFANGRNEETSAMDCESWGIVLFSFIDMTIFSRLLDVMCLSWPLRPTSLWPDDLLLDERVDECSLPSDRSSSSEARDSTLAESSGTSLEKSRCPGAPVDGGFWHCGLVEQQKVSRFHSLQLKFSSLRPSSMDSAQRLNTKAEGAHMSVPDYDERHGVGLLDGLGRGKEVGGVSYRSTC